MAEGSSMEIMSHSNKELVEFFICYMLAQKNYPPTLLKPDDAGIAVKKVDTPVSNGVLVNIEDDEDDADEELAASSSPSGDLDAVKAALQDSADDFELVYTQEFRGLFSQFDITSDTDYHSFKNVMDEVFKDRVNWGRIVGLFAFGGALCVECAQRDMSELVPRIADWMTRYLDEHLSPWMERAGGWDSFGEIFGQGGIVGGRRSRETLKRWLQVGVGLGVLIGVLVAKKQ